MSSAKFMIPAEEFVSSLQGPIVLIRIGPEGPSYTLSKEIVCAKSTYFAAMFRGEFEEGKSQMVTMLEEQGIVSVKSSQRLVQWIYSGEVGFTESEPVKAISAAIEVARLADMVGAAGAEVKMASHITTLLLANPDPVDGSIKNPNRHTCVLKREHLLEASLLPNGHPVRKILADASVEAFTRKNVFRYANETREIPSYSVDLLAAIKVVMESTTAQQMFIEPLGREKEYGCGYVGDDAEHWVDVLR